MWLLILIFAGKAAVGFDAGLVAEAVGKVSEASYDEAAAYFEQGLSDRPDLLQFFKQWLFFSAHRKEKKEPFEKALEEEAGRLRQSGTQNPDSLLLEGMWNGLLALCRVEKGSLLPAYRSGRYAYETLRKVLSLDPGRFDAYFGLGLYHKMKYELAAEAWFVPASDRDLSLAKKYLLTASEKGEFTRELAEELLLELSFSEP